jgi:hypothetical protein
MIETFGGLLHKIINDRIATLPNDPKHLFLMLKPKKYEVNCWVNLLE